MQAYRIKNGMESLKNPIPYSSYLRGLQYLLQAFLGSLYGFVKVFFA